MYNIIDQHKQNQSAEGNEIMLTLNDTKSSPVLTSTSDGQKIDCAKVCPCGVPVIPVPDQWLEVMVTGGFKVWHIIFIIIAFVISIIVVYCCFHRCRIPRTKQEIEADLMRTNLTQKFGDYLQEFPNEPTTFLEAVKKVQELEEKWANERDDSGAKKRMGWLKLRGKERQTEKGSPDPSASGAKEDNAAESGSPDAGGQPDLAAESENQHQMAATKDPGDPSKTTGRDAESTSDSKSAAPTATDQQPSEDNKAKPSSSGRDSTSRKESKSKEATRTTGRERPEPASKSETPALVKVHKAKEERALGRQTTTKQLFELDPSGADISKSAPKSEPDGNNQLQSQAQKAKVRRKRDKPNLSRTKATHVVGSHNESLEVSPNILALPVASGHHRSHEGRHHKPLEQAESQHVSVRPATSGEKEATPTSKRDTRPSRVHQSSNRTRKQAVTRGESTLIQIHTDELSPS